MLTIKSNIDADFGPIINVKISVSRPYEDALRAGRRRIPTPIVVGALIDTGADCTLVDVELLVSSLSLRPKGRTQVRSLDTQEGAEKRYTFDVDMIFTDGHAHSGRFTIEVAEHKFGRLPYRVLLGRNLLQHSSFYYNGPDDEFVINI